MAICDGLGTPVIGFPCMSIGGVQAVPWASKERGHRLGPWQWPGACPASGTLGCSRLLGQAVLLRPALPSGWEGLEMQAQPLCLCAELTQPSPFCSLAFNCRTILDRNCFCASRFGTGSGLRTASKLLGGGRGSCLLLGVCVLVRRGRLFAPSFLLKPLWKSVRWGHSRRAFSLLTAGLVAVPLFPQTLLFSLMLVSLTTSYLCISFQPRWGLHASVLLLVNSCC